MNEERVHIIMTVARTLDMDDAEFHRFLEYMKTAPNPDATLTDHLENYLRIAQPG